MSSLRSCIFISSLMLGAGVIATDGFGLGSFGLESAFSAIHSLDITTSTMFIHAFVLTCLVSTSYFVYNIYFHPLARYPGPLLARCTQAYDVYYAYCGTKHINYLALHARYGHIVRYAPNALSINDPAALKAISAQTANVQKAEFYQCFRAAPAAVSTFLAIDKTEHARKRRVLGQAFSESAVKGFEQYVTSHVDDLVERIRGEVDGVGSFEQSKHSWSKACNMATWTNYLVFDIMGDLVFGKSFGTLGNRPENRRGIYLLGRAARRNYVVAAMPFLLKSGLERVLPVLRGLYRDRGEYLAFGKRHVEERMRESGKAFSGPSPVGGDDGASSPTTGSERRDIFSFLLHARDPEGREGFSVSELWMEGNTLIVAGSDSTSTTLAAALHYMLHNPRTLQRLESEVRGTFAHRSEIRSGPKMQSCVYLRACIDETLRMSPAVGGLLPRQVLKGGLSIPLLGVHIPEGMDVGVPIYAIQHHEEYVSAPSVFDPDRWLSEGVSRDRLKEVFCPFGVGNRACLGRPLVYLELSVAITRLIWEFDMRVADVHSHGGADFEIDVRKGRRTEGEYHLKDWFMSANDGPWLEFRSRLGT